MPFRCKRKRKPKLLNHIHVVLAPSKPKTVGIRHTSHGNTGYHLAYEPDQKIVKFRS